MEGVAMLADLDRIVDDLAKLAAEFDAHLLIGKQAQHVVRATADIERAAHTVKVLAMRRVDETGVWRTDGSKTPGRWLAHTTGTSVSDAIGTVELGEQLEQLPDVADAARHGRLSPVQTKMIAKAASKDPDSEEHLVRTARQGSMTKLRQECIAAAQRAAVPGAAAKIHARRYHRDWIDEDGAFRYEGLTTIEAGARLKKTLEGFADQVFHDARRAGVRDTQEQYAADALVRMADAALANTTPATDRDEPPEPPRYTESRVQLVLLADISAYRRRHTIAGETCEIAGIGPVDVAALKRMCGDATVDIALSDGIDIRTVVHLGRKVTRAQYAALMAEGYECNVDGCGNIRNLQIDHLGDGWAVNQCTQTGALAWKCPHCHNLKSHKHWTDGPQLPNGKRKLIPPATPPPDAPP